MKHLLRLALVVALVFCSATAVYAKKQYRVYGIGFYNLENLFDTINNNGKYDLEFSPGGSRQWNGKKYWSKINKLARCIEAMKTDKTPNGPAILGISEIENRSVIQDLVRAKAIAPRGYQIIHHDSPDRRGVDVAMIYNPRMFQPVNVTNHTLRIESNPGLRTRDQLCVTGILGTRKDGRMTGDTINVIVNHWPSRLGGQEQSSYLREGAAALSAAIADSIWREHPDQAVIIMGDLNDDPNDKSCAKVLGAQKEKEGVQAHGWYNPWWKMLDQGIGTLAYKGSWNLFDQIIVSGNLVNPAEGYGLRYRDCRVNNFEFLITKEGPRQNSPLRTFSGGVWLDGYSDHFPTEIFVIQEQR